MSAIYRDMDRAALDAAYNNLAAVPQSERMFAQWQERSDRIAAERAARLDLRYGQAERNRIDFFPSGERSPTLVFFHGGYWQMRSKENFRFVAAGPLAQGINVALAGYTLAPQISLDGIVAEARAAVAWLRARLDDLGADADRLYVCGWSAGGHLAAMCAGEPGVRGALTISGLFDLEPIRLCYVNDRLRLDEAQAQRNSPSRHLAAAPVPVIVAYGTSELPELQRQSMEYAAARARAGLPGRAVPLSGHNHFTILEELADPGGALAAQVRELCAR